MKKNLIFSLLACLVISSTSAQSFQNNIDKSISLAQENQKNVLMVFSGSDWCKPCIQLKQNILKEKQFLDFSEDKLVLLELDFPYRKKNRLSPEQQAHNEQLAEQYNKEGRFPKLLLLSPDKEILGEVSYKKHLSIDQFIKQIEIITAKD